MVASAVTSADARPEILNGEKLIGLAAASKLLPGHRENSHIDSATVWRWITKGAKATGGKVVRLEACRVGSRWLTSAAAVTRFVTALTAASTSGSGEEGAVPASPAQRNRRAAAASAELDRALS